MAKKFMALLMALVLVLGTTTTVFAANSSVGNNEQEIQEIHVSWEHYDDGTPSWTLAMENLKDYTGVYLLYNISLFNENKVCVGGDSVSWYNDPNNQFLASYYEFYMAEHIAEAGAGTYYAAVEVRAIGFDENGMWTETVVASGVSDTCTYKLPDKKLATPNATVDANGIITFDMVEGADHYYVEATYTGYTTRGSYEAKYLTENIFPYDWYMENSEYSSIVNDGKSVTFDFAKFYEYRETNRENNAAADGYTYIRPDYDFTITVQAITSNINEVQSSDVATAGTYSVRKSAVEVNTALDNALTTEAIAKDPVGAKNVLSSVNNKTLIAMMADPTFVVKVAKAEAAYATALKLPPVASVSTSVAVDQTKVFIVGALLNATEEGQQVALAIADAVGVTAPVGYTNGVALDIKLFVGQDSITNLEVPVQITMPIPAGVSAQNLVILHYHEGATEPTIIVPTVNADGTMTFAVDGFSTFIVANQGIIAAPKTGDMITATLVCSMLLLAAGAVVLMRRKSMVK